METTPLDLTPPRYMDAIERKIGESAAHYVGVVHYKDSPELRASIEKAIIAVATQWFQYGHGNGWVDAKRFYRV